MKTPQFYAQLYDEVVHDWPDEINFYRQLIEENGISSLLEVACGTGRVMLKLIREGMEVTGVDLDTALLEVARTKANGHPSVTLREGDMQSFHLDRTFQLAIIPGHSFQFMLASEAQLNCITNIERHLIANGLLVVHLDYPEIDWLGDLTRGLGGVFGVEAEVSHPETGGTFRTSKAWSYDPSSQIASAVTRWEELGADGSTISQNDSEPTALHCVFPFEMEHLLARSGFVVEHVYGDFARQPFAPQSFQMIWVARKK